MAYTKASQKAVDKYCKENYETYLLRFKKGEKIAAQNHAEVQGKSLNAYIIELIEKDMQSEEA